MAHRGTLHQFTDPWFAAHSPLGAVVSALFALLGVAGAHGLAIARGWEAPARREGIVGFNGALVGGIAELALRLQQLSQGYERLLT